jgi:hypothetical protein
MPPFVLLGMLQLGPRRIEVSIRQAVHSVMPWARPVCELKCRAAAHLSSRLETRCSACAAQLAAQKRCASELPARKAAAKFTQWVQRAWQGANGRAARSVRQDRLPNQVPPAYRSRQQTYGHPATRPVVGWGARKLIGRYQRGCAWPGRQLLIRFSCLTSPAHAGALSAKLLSLGASAQRPQHGQAQAGGSSACSPPVDQRLNQQLGLRLMRKRLDEEMIKGALRQVLR